MMTILNRRSIWLFLISLSASCSVYADETMLRTGPRIGLVLAGGGAAGVAHVGVIKELERLGIRPDCVVGTSMGAIVAGLYASGYSPAELEQVVLDIDWTSILNDNSDRSTQHPMRRDSRVDPFSVSAQLPIGINEDGIQVIGGLVDGVKLSLLLRELTARAASAVNFDALPIPFRAIATDLVTGEQVIMKDGDLAHALRASMSIPGLFPAVKRNGRILVDGGVVNNFPTDVARELCAEVIIGVNIPGEEPDPRSLSTLTGSLVQLMALIVDKQAKKNEAALTHQDILIVPPVAEIGMLGFARAPEAVAIGISAAEAKSARLRALAEGRPDPQLAHVAEPLITSLIEYDRIAIHNNSGLDDAVITARLGLPAAGQVDTDDLQRRLQKIYGLDLFSSVNYRIDHQDDERVLVVIAEERTSGRSQFRLGLFLEDDFNGEGDYTLGFGTSFTQLNKLGGRINLDTALGANTGFRIEFEQPLDFNQTLFLQPTLGFIARTVPLYEKPGKRIADFRVKQSNVGVDFIWAPSESIRIGVGASYQWRQIELKTGSTTILEANQLDEDWQGGFRVGALFDYDTLDDADLPRFGQQFVVQVNVDPTDSEEDMGDILVDGLAAYSFGQNTLAGFTRIDAELDPDGIEPHFLGGFQRLSGFSRDELFGNIALMAGVRAYRRLAFDSLFGNEAFVGGSIEYGGVWDEWKEVDASDGLLHGSIFSGAETSFGPFVFSLGFGENDQWAMHFSLGQRF